jgi:hypothetical protein
MCKLVVLETCLPLPLAEIRAYQPAGNAQHSFGPAVEDPAFDRVFLQIHSPHRQLYQYVCDIQG